LLQKFLPRGGFLRAAAGLAGASLLAQAIGVLAAPVLARLFDPAQVGALALFSSAAGLLGIFAGGRWHLAFAPATPADRRALLSLVLATAGAFAIGLTLLALPLGPMLARHVGTTRAFWLWLAPAGAALMATNQALRWLAVAEGNARRAGQALMLRPAVATACQLGVGFAGGGELGLVGGAMAGWLAADLLLLAGRRFERSAARIREAGARWRHFPIQALPAALATQATIALPEFYIALRHGALEVGLYAMVVRLLAAPVMVLGEAVSALWWRRAAEQAAGPVLLRQFDRLVGVLGIAALAGGLLVVACGPQLFALVLGSQWSRAGALARLIVPYHAMRLVSAPVLATGAALGRPGIASLWSGIDLALALAASAAGILLGLSLEAWLALYAGLGAASRVAAVWLMRTQAAGTR
jgi:O-antigen/teichoic acid export membrane protein